MAVALPIKIYVKGNFLIYKNETDLFFADNVENILLSKNSTSSTSYYLYMRGINKLINDIAFADISDENGNAYSTQAYFENYIYTYTGNRVSLPLVSIGELNDVTISAPSNGQVLEYNATSGQWENVSIVVSNQLNDHFVLVNQKSDLPTPDAGVITLSANVTYYFTNVVDLTGDRIECSANTTILGGSSENCRIKSTGLTGTALITSSYSLPIRNITLEADVALNLYGDGVTTALDWFGVNFTDCNTVGTISNYSNFVMGDSAFLNSQGLTFAGTIGTIGMSNCLFDCRTSGTAITIASTANITRRFRIIYSSFVILSGETAINFSSSATVGSERYILDTVNFSGGGTYTTGITYTDNKALFVNCVGITNTSTKGYMYMLNNTTDTPIGVPNVNVWVKASGTTSAGTNSKFTHTTNRLTYNGAFSGSFLVTLNATTRSANSNQVTSIGIAKNGTIIADSEGIIRTTTSNVEHGGSTQAVLEMVANDYIELFVRNTNSADIRVTDFNFNVIKIPV